MAQSNTTCQHPASRPPAAKCGLGGGTLLLALALAMAMASIPAVQAADAAGVAVIPNAITEVPSQAGVMVGAPPAPDKMVSLANYASPRFMRWTMTHMSSVFNTARVSRGTGLPTLFAEGKPLAVDALSVNWQGRAVAMPEVYRLLGADALLVLHRGQLVFERYFGDMRADSLHATNSCTKSFVGTLAATLVQEGKLDAEAPASRYVPELAASALGSATISQLLDMRANFAVGNDVHVAGSLQLGVLQGYGAMPRPKDYAGPDGAIAMMLAARPTTPHGTGPMRYDNLSSEALSWVMHRVTGQSVPELISERFWKPLGAETDADFMLDTRKTPIGAFGLQASARDLARFGEMMRNEGRFNGRQIVPAAVVSEIRRGGDRAAFAASHDGPVLPQGSYHDMWWFNHDELDSFQCQGQFAQRVWIAPKADTVVVLLSVDPDATRSREPLRLSTFRAIAQALKD